ncbi:probable purine permease 10 isoform X2 [Neltuma alba]|uniref:probable purine permease 10 isoform X2 n=1 Tax=Neltuma alba TaxID=207710 RepID=UPI0010A53E80|nr:probable purine permease 10 isoform X2 [Prosopis alba]
MLHDTVVSTESGGAKDKKNPNVDTESDAAKQTDHNGDAGDIPNEESSAIKNKKRHQRWLRIAVYVVSVLVAQSAATLLGRQYYQEGGHSKWLGTLVQLVGFPILLPLYSIPASKKKFATNTVIHNQEQPPFSKLALVYVTLGLIVALDCYLYSVGLSYLPVSTFSLISSSQLAFNAFFSFFLNSLKFTPYIINSLVVLTISSVILVFHIDSPSASTQVSKQKYVIGFICTVAGSAGYGLVLSLTQLAFGKVFKRVNFKVILDMIIYQFLVATLATLVGLFASGEFRGLQAEMKEYRTGKASYVLNLSFAAITWQVFSVGSVGLILEVSSVFSNVITVLGLPIVPILAVIFFHDKMNGLKVISLFLALWGFLSYTYQQYLDETNSQPQHRNSDALSRDSLNGVSEQVENRTV